MNEASSHKPAIRRNGGGAQETRQSINFQESWENLIFKKESQGGICSQSFVSLMLPEFLINPVFIY